MHVAAEAVDRALAGERDQLHVAGLAGLEAHRGAGGDVEPHAARLLAVELQRRIGLEEMIVRADLDRPVAGIGDRQRHRLAAGIEFDLAVLDEVRRGSLLSVPRRNPINCRIRAWPPRNAIHRIGSCTVTSLVPSGNVASTWMSWIISAMPSMHLRAGDDLRAGLHQLGDGAAVARALDDEIGDDARWLRDG